MPTPFIMPKFDMDQENATIVSWLKHEGDQVRQDEAVLVVETDKVAIDVPAPASGQLAGIAFKEGDQVPVATVIAFILGQGESAECLPAAPLPTAQVASQGAPVPAAAASPVARRLARDLGIDVAHVPAVEGRVTKADIERYLQSAPALDDKIPATPAARRLARERGIDLRSLAGTGPKGRVQAGDVPRKPELPQRGPGRPGQIVPLVGMRRTIAERMQSSFQQAPHIALTVEADVTVLEQTRQGMNATAQQQQRPTVSLTALLVRLTGWALERHPYLNASLQDDGIHLWSEINIGVATAVPNGLIVPIIRGANRLSVAEIGQAMHMLTQKAREGRLELRDVQDGTFTISNLGMFGIRQFRAVINPPESAILAVGAVVRKPVVINDRDEIAARPILTLTLSADHRVLDGVLAANFLGELVQVIEDPGVLLN